jgi:hypothetical protein
MNAKSLDQARRPTQPLDDRIEDRPAPPLSRACCCPARPVVRVIIPPTATRPHSVDLLLCGHHYRVSCEALAAVNATVTEQPEMSGDRPTALLPDMPHP